MSRQGYIQITRNCNQDCIFCSNPPSGRDLTFEEAKQIVESLAKEGHGRIIFTGGEPTLAPFLPELVSYTAGLGVPCRIITNGQNISDRNFFDGLYRRGLRSVNLSLYSVRAEVQGFLSNNPDSFGNIEKALAVLGGYPDVHVTVNTVINKYNCGHLSENIRWLMKNAPFVKHIVWNNLDPTNDKVAANPGCVARLNDFHHELHRAVNELTASGRTCRIERVPLCYMAGFEHLSTETRKIVKQEKTTIYFLDEKGAFSQEKFQYGKTSCCKSCFLDSICAGLYEMDVHYYSEELYACFIEKDSVVNKIYDTTKSWPKGR